MSATNALKIQGWHLSDNGIAEITDGKPLSANEIISKAIDVDLRDFGSKSLPDDLSGGKQDNFGGNVVLQINSIKNICQPKSAEKDLTSSSAGPHLLRVQMTDGVNTISGLGLESIHNLRSDTLPGTKIYIKPGKIVIRQGFVMLNNMTCKILGGNVQHMVHKWQLNRNAARMAKSRNVGQDGNCPPPWVPFGHRINSNVDTKGKALDAGANNNSQSKNPEFEEQRKAVIAEAVKTKQVTQTKHYTDSGIKQVPQAANKQRFEAKSMESNAAHAEESVPKTTVSGQGANREKPAKPSLRNERFSKRDHDKEDEAEVPASFRPSGPSTLFDFLNMKMTLGDDNNTQTSEPPEKNIRQNFEKPDYSRRSTNRQSFQQDNRRQNNAKQYEERNQRFGGNNNQRNDSRGKTNPNRGGQFENHHHNPHDRNYQFQYPSLSQQEVPQQNVQTEPQKATRRYDDNGAANHRANYNNRRPNNAFQPNDQRRARNKFTEGDKVMAKYWEDNKFYPAVVHQLSSNGETCVVQYLNFMNYEEVLCSDIYQSSANDGSNESGANAYSGKKMEFRKGGRGKQYSENRLPPNEPQGNRRIPGQYQQPQQNRRSNNNQRSGGTGSGRQLYVPPAQRPNNP